MKKEKAVKTEYGTISLALPLIEKIKQRIEGTGMASVSAYVSFILRQVLSSQTPDTKDFINKKEEKEIKNRLKNLGYT